MASYHVEPHAGSEWQQHLTPFPSDSFLYCLFPLWHFTSFILLINFSMLACASSLSASACSALSSPSLSICCIICDLLVLLLHFLIGKLFFFFFLVSHFPHVLLSYPSLCAATGLFLSLIVMAGSASFQNAADIFPTVAEAAPLSKEKKRRKRWTPPHPSSILCFLQLCQASTVQQGSSSTRRVCSGESASRRLMLTQTG